MKKRKIKFKMDEVNILRIVVVILLLLIIILIMNNKKMSVLEEKSINSYSSKMINYVENLSSVKENEIDKYIISAVKYYYNEENKTEIKVDEISKFIKENYNVTISTKKILELGLSEKLIKENIQLNTERKAYSYQENKTLKDIASTKIPVYKLEKIKKKNKVTYQAIYQKYIIKNPYEVLNYYDKLNNKKKTYNKYDTTNLLNYLTGKTTVKEFINSIDMKDLEKFGKKKEKMTIEYKVIDNNLTIKKISK